MPNNIYETSTIAEMNTGIILANFEKDDIIRETSYQTEKELEELMIENLISQGYQRIKINNNEELYKNLR